MLAPARTAVSRNRMSYISTKGLQNAPGENNCFLNCAVQVFWHLDIFRRSFRILSGHACLGHSCIFCALKVIFTQFQYSDQSVLPPNSLRKALAEAFADQHRFQLGLMDDAAECFENILTRIHFHIANQEKDDHCRAPHCLPHRKFALAVREQICCPCGAETEPFPYNQMVLYVSAKSLSTHAQKWMEEERTVFDPSERFSELVGRAHGQEDMRECPSKCGQRSRIRRHLVNNPDIVSLGLIWETDRPSFDYILDVSETIGTTLKLQEVYDGLVTDHVRNVEYQLMGVVCYYGKHYSTFMKNSKSGAWMYFDDAAVQEIGRNFQDVIDKCCKSRYLPLLLFYVNPEGSVIDPSTAPSETVPVPGYTQRVHDRTSSSELELTGERRAVTPTPFGGQKSPRDKDRERRAVTPGPEQGERKRHRDRSEHKRDRSKPRRDTSKPRRNTDHQRQGSFLIAVQGGMESTEIDIESDSSNRSRRRGRSGRHLSNVSQMSRISDASRGSDQSRGSDVTDGPPPPYNESKHPGKVSLVKEKVQRHAANIQRQNSNASTASSAPSRRQKADSVSSDADSYTAQDNSNKSSPNHRMNMAILNKASMLQRKESFKKGKDKIPADVIRFVKPPSECSDDGQPSQKPDFQRTKSLDPSVHQRMLRLDVQHQISDPTGQRYDHEEKIYQRPSELRKMQGGAQIGQRPQLAARPQTRAVPVKPPQAPPPVPSHVPQRKTMDDSYMQMHAGTYVDNGFASLPRQKRKPLNQQHNYVNQSELTLHEETSNPTKPVMMQQQQNDAMYISRKAVESILKRQGQNQMPYKMRQPQAKTQPNQLKVNLEVASQDSGYRSANGTSPSYSGTSPSWSGGRGSSNGDSPPCGFPDPPPPEQLAMARAEPTKTEFARPNEAQHQHQFANVRQLRTSEHRNETSQRDRQEAVTPRGHVTSPREQNPRDHDTRQYENGPRGQREHQDPRGQSTTPRDQYNQASHGMMPHEQNHHPRDQHHQPREQNHHPRDQQHQPREQNHHPRVAYHHPRDQHHQPREQNNHPRDQQHHPRDQLHQPRDQQHHPRDAHHQPRGPAPTTPRTEDVTSPRYNHESLLSPDHTPQASINSEGEAECTALYNQAEDLMRMSLQREEQGDVHGAILHCTRAMVALKDAMDIPYVDYQSYIRAQMKHNTCIIRNKFLHKRLSSVDSSDGTLSGGRSSASSTGGDNMGSTETLSSSRRQHRTRSHSASGSLQNLTDLPDHPRHSRSAALSGDEAPQKPTVSVKPSLKQLKAKNSNDANSKSAVEKEYDIYGTLPRKPKKLTNSISVPENLNTADEAVVMRPKKNPPPPPMRRSSLVNSEATMDDVKEATRHYEQQQPTLLLAPPMGNHARQSSELSEWSLPPYPEVDQNEYLYQQPGQAELKLPLDTRWAIPADDPGFCRRCQQNQFWIPETSTCLRCDVQKKSPRDPSAMVERGYAPPPHGRHENYRRPAYNQYTVQYVTTNGNPALDPNDKHHNDIDCHSPDKSQYSSSHGSQGAFSPDEGIGLSSSDTTRQESTTDSDMSENKRSVLELALRFDQSKLARLNQPKNLQTFAMPKPKTVTFRADVEQERPEERHRKAGYDSDYDEDTSDSCASGSSSPYRCGLCQKRKVDPPAVYCRDCSTYMTRFSNPKPKAKPEPAMKPRNPQKYTGNVKTV